MMVLTFNGTDHGKREEALRTTADRLAGSVRLPSRPDPAMDVLEQDGSIVVKMNVPGARPENVEIGLEKNVLTVKVQPTGAPEAGRYLLRERSEGEVSRTVTLPYEVDSSQATASCKNGVLTLVLPRHRPAQQIRINVD
ncbi:MAG: Hsp20/alpha crystallin family protein [Candidatus Xenobia bacterium]